MRDDEDVVGRDIELWRSSKSSKSQSSAAKIALADRCGELRGMSSVVE
jgi:hypothetical protein